MAERKDKNPSLLEQNRLAGAFLNDVDGLNRKYGMIGALGLKELKDWRTFRLYFAVMDARETAQIAQRSRSLDVLGLEKSAIYLSQRVVKRVRDPLGVALKALEAEYSDHVSLYPERETDRPLRIQNAVSNLVERIRVSHVMPLMNFRTGGMSEHAFEMWQPKQEAVKEWGRELGSTIYQREQGL